MEEITIVSAHTFYLRLEYGPISIRLSPSLHTYIYPRQACVIGGTLASIVNDYQHQVDFLAVYLSEAHASDGWAQGSKASHLAQHRSLEERIAAAK